MGDRRIVLGGETRIVNRRIRQFFIGFDYFLLPGDGIVLAQMQGNDCEQLLKKRVENVKLQNRENSYVPENPKEASQNVNSNKERKNGGTRTEIPPRRRLTSSES